MKYSLGIFLPAWHNWLKYRLTYDGKVWVKVFPGVWKFKEQYPFSMHMKQMLNKFYDLR